MLANANLSGEQKSSFNESLMIVKKVRVHVNELLKAKKELTITLVKKFHSTQRLKSIGSRIIFAFLPDIPEGQM